MPESHRQHIASYEPMHRVLAITMGLVFLALGALEVIASRWAPAP